MRRTRRRTVDGANHALTPRPPARSHGFMAPAQFHTPIPTQANATTDFEALRPKCYSLLGLSMALQQLRCSRPLGWAPAARAS
jgi:hypothetical protein